MTISPAGPANVLQQTPPQRQISIFGSSATPLFGTQSPQSTGFFGSGSQTVGFGSFSQGATAPSVFIAGSNPFGSSSPSQASPPVFGMGSTAPVAASRIVFQGKERKAPGAPKRY